MTQTEHNQVMHVVRQRLERNVGNMLTEDLATGIMAIIEHGVKQLVTDNGEPDRTTSDA